MMKTERWRDGKKTGYQFEKLSFLVQYLSVLFSYKSAPSMCKSIEHIAVL